MSRKRLVSLLVAFILISISFTTIASANESESNNTFSTADQFTAGDQQLGYISSTTDLDYYSVYMRAGTNATISLINIPSGCDYDLHFYSPSQSLLASGINGSNNEEFVRYSNLPSDRYYFVEVFSYTSYSTTSAYSLSATIGDKITSNTNSSYNEGNAASYANNNYNVHNSSYPNFSVDCTNFASQCLYNGGMSLRDLSSHGSLTSSWWFDMNYQAPFASVTWSAANDFQKQWTNVRSSTFYGRAYQVKIYTMTELRSTYWSEIVAMLNPGDIIQYGNRSDCYAHHSQVVYWKGSRSGIGTDFWIAQHSDDQLYSFYDYLFSGKISPSDWVWVINIKQ